MFNRQFFGGLVVAPLIFLSTFPLMLGVDLAKEYAPIVLAAYASLGAVIFSYSKNSVQFVSPNSLVFFYCSISLALGSLGMRDGVSLQLRSVSEYEQHAYTHVALSFIMLGLATLPLAQIWLGRPKARDKLNCTIKLKCSIPVFLVFAPIVIFGIDLSAIGGSDSLGIYAQSLLSIYLILLLHRYGATARYIGFIAILLTMVVLHPFDKRHAIFLVFPFIFLEVRTGAMRFSLRSMVALFLLVCLLIFLLLAMSIARGYGGYDVDESVILAMSFIGEYISSDIFLAAFFQNIEVTYFYFHYVNAVEFVLSGQAELALGSTLIKPLFIPIPRDVIAWKPDSIIHLYTSAYDPKFRAMGGSWPPNFAAEYIWNFHIFGVLLFPLFAWMNVRVFNILMNLNASARPFLFAFYLFIYMNIFVYARGSGIDLFVFIIALGGVLLICCSVVHLMLVNAARR